MASENIKIKRTFSLDKEIINTLEELSKETMIPQSRLLDKALRDLFKSYGKDTE